MDAKSEVTLNPTVTCMLFQMSCELQCIQTITWVEKSCPLMTGKNSTLPTGATHSLRFTVTFLGEVTRKSPDWPTLQFAPVSSLSGFESAGLLN